MCNFFSKHARIERVSFKEKFVFIIDVMLVRYGRIFVRKIFKLAHVDILVFFSERKNKQNMDMFFQRQH